MRMIALSIVATSARVAERVGRRLTVAVPTARQSIPVCSLQSIERIGVERRSTRARSRPDLHLEQIAHDLADLVDGFLKTKRGMTVEREQSTLDGLEHVAPA